MQATDQQRPTQAPDHPYICKIYQTGEEAGRPFIAMEYVRGETLKDRLAAEPMPLKDVLRIAVEIAEALETAHAAQIVHRDLKPANIMITTGGHVKVLDFGLAKRVDTEDATDETRSELTLSGTVQGTPAYMSPEQVRGHEVDSRSDIFSLGVVLYEALTGTNPFRANSSLETASEILHRTPPAPSRAGADVPPLLEHIVQKMLAKTPDDRYQLMHELRTDLARVREATDHIDPEATTVVVDGAAVSAIRQPSAKSPAQTALSTSSLGRRRGAQIGVAAAVLTAVVAVGIWWNNAPAVPVANPAPLSVAVAPLANVSGDPDSDYLANGIAQAVTTRLHRAGLRVIPFETVVRFPNTGDPTELARALNVDAVLTSSLQSDGDRLLVTVSLVEGESGFTLWTDEFEETFDNLFDVQTRIAQGVAARLGQELTGEAQATLALAESSSVDAYDLYLQGAELVMDGDQESTEIGYQLFSRAVEIDPDLGDAHVGLGAVFSERFWSGWGGGAGNLALAEASFERALQLNAKNMRARRGLMHLQFYRGHSEEGLRLAQEVTRLGSDDIETLLATSEAYTLHGLPYVAAPLLRQVLALDPGNENAAWLGLLRIFYSEQFDEGASLADAYVRQFGDNPYVNAMGGYAYLRLGDIDGARQRYDRAAEQWDGWSAELGLATAINMDALASAGVFYDRHGQPDRAQALWRKGLELTQAALENDPDSIGLHLFLASFHGYLGERALFQSEEADALATLVDANINPYGLLYLVGAHAHLGNTERALDILRRQLRDGRLPALGYVGTVAPTLLDTSEFTDFRREYEAERQRLRDRYASAG